MLASLFHVQHVSVLNAPKLYPRGLNWRVQEGINVVVGGTGLGKSTFVNAMLFGLFGPLGTSKSKRHVEHIGADYFRGRLAPEGDDDQTERPTVTVQALFGEAMVEVERDLLSGRVLRALIAGSAVQGIQFEQQLLKQLGLQDFDTEWMRLHDHLLYLGESRYLLAWDNQIQSELITLLFEDLALYQRSYTLWQRTMSLDSRWRNLRSQRVAQESELERLKGNEEDGGELRASEREQLRLACAQAEARRNATARKRVEADRRSEELAASLLTARTAYNLLSARLLEAESAHQDETLRDELLGTATQKSILHATRAHAESKGVDPCPLCGTERPEDKDLEYIRQLAAWLRRQKCPCCGTQFKPPPVPRGRRGRNGGKVDAKLSRIEAQIMQSADELRTLLTATEELEAEQRALVQQFSDAQAVWEQALAAQTRFVQEQGGTDRIASQAALVSSLEEREVAKERERNQANAEFNRHVAQVNRKLGALEEQVAELFARYAAMFLDEECRVELAAGELFNKPGAAQIQAPHRAFYPIVGDDKRNTPSSLSEAQRLFIDMAFRMALIELWHQQTGRGATLVVETPEGTVDIAYTVRVAEMLREFSARGHTVIVTTNLNNDILLPALLVGSDPATRKDRILNLLELGLPKPVQRQYQAEFNRIINLALNG